MRNEQQQQDYRDGYRAGVEFHMGYGGSSDAPDEIHFDDDRRSHWMAGFVDAGLDS